MNLSASEINELTRAMKNNNLSIAEVIQRIQGKTIFEKAKNEEINLLVDYSLSLQEMISAGGYVRIHGKINKNNFYFPNELKSKKVSVSARLFHYNIPISSQDAINKIDKAGFRLATLAELLSLGSKYPELQYQFPIVALGSLEMDVYGALSAPFLGVSDYDRKLDLYCYSFEWKKHYRFLAIRKLSDQLIP